MKCSDYEIYASRNAIVDHLYDVWNAAKNDSSCDPEVQACWSSDIWRKANTLQALVQFCRTADASNPRRQKALNLMGEAYQLYAGYIDSHDVWVDDFGWWAGFFVDLHRVFPPGMHPKPLENIDFLKETRRCYDRMLANLDDKKGQSKFYADHGGIWNHRPADSPTAECGDCEKNTVTNAWMLNVASDLYAWDTGSPNRNDYKDKADEQYTWLTTGKYGSYSPTSWDLYNQSNGLLWWLPGERPGSVYWSGDEGVFLRGVEAYSRVNPAKKGEILKNGKKLVDAAIAQFPDAQKVMHESAGTLWNNKDLATGKGVFMRLVTRVVQEWNYFKDVDPGFKKTFDTFVNATAESAWCSGDKKTGTTASNWNPPYGPPLEGKQPTSGGLWPWVHQTNGLDALNAAVQILRAQQD